MDHAQRMQKLSEQQAALRQGDEAAVAAHRAAGKLTARDRVSQLLDAGTFVEMEAYATQGHVVTGYGLINSRPAYVIAQDVTQQGGAISLAQARKISKTLTLAQTSGAPVILMPDSKGMLVQEGAELLAAYAQVLGELAGLRGTCPVITLLAGEAVGIAAHFVQVADIAIAVDGGSLVAPFAPSVMRAVHGEKLTDAKLGGAEALAAKGMAALTAKDEQEARFRRVEQDRRNRLSEQLVDLLKRSARGGFVPIPGGTARLPLNDGEVLCWDSQAKKLRQRTYQGQPYWEWKHDDEGRLLVTNQRLVFATSDARRWQRPLVKMHTARVDEIRFRPGPANDVNILVVGFDDLQKPVAFWPDDMQVRLTINDYPCSATLVTTDLHEMLQSRLSA